MVRFEANYRENLMQKQNLSTELRSRIQVVRGVPLTTSLAVAEHFEKEHRDVLRAIRNEIAAHADLDFTDQHFFEAEHFNSRGKPIPIYRLTEIGFALIAMGFTGSRAKRWQRAYTTTFAAMRQSLLDDGDERTRQLFQESSLWRSKAMVADMECRALKTANDQLRLQMEQWRREAGTLKLRQHYSNELLKKEFGTTAAQALIELKGSLSEVMIEAALAEEHHRDELEIARRSQAHPDFERFCASEVFVHLLSAMKNRLYSALLLWALLQARALDAPVRLVSRRQGWQPHQVLKPYAVPLKVVLSYLGEGVSRGVLHQAALKLAQEGLLVMTRQRSSARSRREIWHYQARLEPLMQRLQSANPSLLTRQEGRLDFLPAEGTGLPEDALLLDEFDGYAGWQLLSFVREQRAERLRQLAQAREEREEREAMQERSIEQPKSAKANKHGTDHSDGSI